MRKHFTRKRRFFIRETALSKFIPSALTTLALCAGMTAVLFGIRGRWEAAVIAILIASILDVMDGGIARLLKGQSKFGAELDSLSDVISFGAAPAIVNYLWILNEAKSLGWIACLIFTVCSALRLARFNAGLGASDLPPWAYKFFSGVPAPAGAGLSLMPMLASFEIDGKLIFSPYLIAIWITIVGLLMISKLPTFALKGIHIREKYIFPALAVVGILSASLVAVPWITLGLLCLAYVISLPISYYSMRRLERSFHKPRR